MIRLDSTQMAAFTRRYRFNGGRIRRVRIRYGRGERFAIELVLTARPTTSELGTAPAPVRLKLRLTGVEEFRFQKRPTAPSGPVPEARIGYFSGLYYINLDAWGLAPGEVPKVHDYRASDTYLAARELYYEEMPPRRG